jgi:transposase InsO family protein
VPTLIADNGGCFHATLKKEEVHWRLYDGPQHARQCLEEFRDRYNRIRPHWALRSDERVNPHTPTDVYENGLVVILCQCQEKMSHFCQLQGVG